LACIDDDSGDVFYSGLFERLEGLFPLLKCRYLREGRHESGVET